MPEMNTIITGDQSWVYEYDLETKSQSSQLHTKLKKPLKKATIRKYNNRDHVTSDTRFPCIRRRRCPNDSVPLKYLERRGLKRFLTNEQKLCRLATCEDMMEMTRTDPEWKDKIITGDETWVYGYDPETKPQSAEWRALYMADINPEEDIHPEKASHNATLGLGLPPPPPVRPPAIGQSKFPPTNQRDQDPPLPPTPVRPPANQRDQEVLALGGRVTSGNYVHLP
ncbi:hypothetical protein LAZ67_X004139 [Cordylochernes scorpioides]|uniref:Uncharacterized protein n=1 Tax=Cordylochernes scorpioides TaxID=51811 RepID=A0ABY6LWV0_9ARAC|nr:hypothetical protein LAZ67_X004139 [Cordylochernes scorpioides]